MASTQNMDRWTIELQLHMTKESKRFKSAKMFQRYKETVLEILERENPDQQQQSDGQQQQRASDNSLQMDKINDRLDSVRLSDFLGRIADNCATLGEMCLLERSLRDCLLQARRKSFLLSAGDHQSLPFEPNSPTDPMCYFCASHLEHPSSRASSGAAQRVDGESAGAANAVPALMLPQIQFVPQRTHEAKMDAGGPQSQQSNAGAADTPPCSSGAPSPDVGLEEAGERAGRPEAEQHYKRAFYYQPQPFRSTTPPLPDDPAARAAFLAASSLPCSSASSELAGSTCNGEQQQQQQPPSKRRRARHGANAKTTNASSQHQEERRRASRKQQLVAVGESSLCVDGEEELRGPLVIAESPQPQDTHEDSMEEFFQELNERPPSRQPPPWASTPVQEEKKKKALGAAVAALVAAGVERLPSGEFRASRLGASLQPEPAPAYSQPAASAPRPAGSQLKRKRTAKKRAGSSLFKAASQSYLDTSFANLHSYSSTNLAGASDDF